MTVRLSFGLGTKGVVPYRGGLLSYETGGMGATFSHPVRGPGHGRHEDSNGSENVSSRVARLNVKL